MSSSKDVPKPQPYGQSPVDLAKVSKKLQVLKASQDSEEAGEGRRYEVDFDSNKVIGYEVDYASDSEDEDAHMAWAMGYEESEDSDSIEGKGEAGVTKYNDVKDYNAAEGKSTAHLTKVEEVDETSEDSGKIQEKGKSNVTKVKAAKFQYAKDSDKANTNANANAKAPHVTETMTRRKCSKTSARPKERSRLSIPTPARLQLRPVLRSTLVIGTHRTAKSSRAETVLPARKGFGARIAHRTLLLVERSYLLVESFP